MISNQLQKYINGCERYYLKPGFIFASERPLVIQTVLGSCVSVCLHDQRRNIGGMNHFQMPHPGDGPRTAKYGQASTEALINILRSFGSQPGDLVAQLFGGASMPEKMQSLQVGNDNVAIAREVLKQQGVPIISEDVGGYLGRKLLFITELNQVLVFKIHHIRSSDFYDYHDKRRERYEQSN